jgi:uncharacterized lipoprotein YajG
MKKFLNLLAACILLTACETTKSGVSYHNDLQKYYNYDAAKNRSTAFTAENSKEALKLVKKQAKDKKKLDKTISEREKIINKINALKKQ